MTHEATFRNSASVVKFNKLKMTANRYKVSFGMIHNQIIGSESVCLSD